MKKLDETHPILGEITNNRYNNGVTYHKYWETPENKKYQEMLEKRFFDRSRCSPDCPLSWSKEVLELLDSLDKEFGIQYNTETIRGYSIQGNPWKWFVLDPLKSVTVSHLEYLLRKSFTDDSKWLVRYMPKSFPERLKAFPKRAFKSVIGLFSYYTSGFAKFRVIYINKVLNKLLGKKIELGQIKEKYGTLRVYLTTPEYMNEYVGKCVRETEIKLSMKGAYYPLSGFWNSYSGWAVGTEHHPDVIEVEDKDGYSYIKETKYRKILKDLLPKEEFDKLKESGKPLNEED